MFAASKRMSCVWSVGGICGDFLFFAFHFKFHRKQTQSWQIWACDKTNKLLAFLPKFGNEGFMSRQRKQIQTFLKKIFVLEKGNNKTSTLEKYFS